MQKTARSHVYLLFKKEGNAVSGATRWKVLSKGYSALH